jgi:hypothetical protein
MAYAHHKKHGLCFLFESGTSEAEQALKDMQKHNFFYEEAPPVMPMLWLHIKR